MTWLELGAEAADRHARGESRANTSATRAGVTQTTRLLTMSAGRGHHGSGRKAGDSRTGAMRGRVI